MLENSLEDLARQELTPREVREVLTRLGQAELGGSEAATIAAVAEAANSDAETIGAILVTLRGEEFRKRFETVLDNHEARLARLEKGEKLTPQTKVKDYSYDAVNYLMTPTKTKATPIVIVLAIALAIAVFMFYFLASPPSALPGIKINNQEVTRDHPIARSLNHPGN